MESERERETVADILNARSAPMLLLDVVKLRELGKLPRYDEVEQFPVSFADVSENDCVLFVSHRWWRAKNPDGDYSEKVQILLEHLPVIRDAQSLAPKNTFFVWWDGVEVLPDERQQWPHIHKVEKSAQILSIPIYLADSAIAFKAGDEQAYTVGKGDPNHTGWAATTRGGREGAVEERLAYLFTFLDGSLWGRTGTKSSSPCCSWWTRTTPCSCQESKFRLSNCWPSRSRTRSWATATAVATCRGD